MVIKEVAQYLKRFAYKTMFVVKAIIDGDCRPQSKRDSFARRYTAYMDKINGYYCCQSAIVLSTREYLTEEQTSMVDELNKEAGKLDHMCLIINPDFYTKLQIELEMISAHDDNGHNTGYININIVRAEYQADYIIAHCYISGDTDMIFSTDSDFSALTGSNCICIRSMKGGGKKNDGKKNINVNVNEITSFVYEIVGSSNSQMNDTKKMLDKDNCSKNISW